MNESLSVLRQIICDVDNRISSARAIIASSWVESELAHNDAANEVAACLARAARLCTDLDAELHRRSRQREQQLG